MREWKGGNKLKGKFPHNMVAGVSASPAAR